MTKTNATAPATVIATAEGYTATLTGDRITICRESGEWAGDGRWEDGRIVDCPARLGDTDEESERVYAELEMALVDELDEAERLEAERLEAEARYIIVQAAPCDGGLMVARLASGENEDDCARRCGAVIRSYGPEDENGASERPYTRSEAFAELARLEAEEAEWEVRREAEFNKPRGPRSLAVHATGKRRRGVNCRKM